MKLKVPIEKWNLSVPCATSFNACLDKVSQCEVEFNEDKLAEVIYKDLGCENTFNEKWADAPDINRRVCLNEAKAIIAAMPSILTIKRNEK